VWCFRINKESIYYKMIFLCNDICRWSNMTSFISCSLISLCANHNTYNCTLNCTLSHTKRVYTVSCTCCIMCMYMKYSQWSQNIRIPSFKCLALILIKSNIKYRCIKPYIKLLSHQSGVLTVFPQCTKKLQIPEVCTVQSPAMLCTGKCCAIA